MLCEIDPAAQAVLRAGFAGVPLESDVRDLRSLPEVEILAAGFPCQDLSQAGRTAGIRGTRSGLVGEVFRLLTNRRRTPRWVLLENVPFMLQLDRGRAMRYLTRSLEDLGFRWAYRVVDTRAFGLPHRRQRVILLASRSEDPRQVLLADDVGEPVTPSHQGKACGFYWTEGVRGLGWAVDAVPTLKGGSTIGIPSPPAIWMPNGEIVTPSIRDAERLQGFDPDWTLPAVGGRREGARWKLVGNAVSVPVAAWIASRLRNPSGEAVEREAEVEEGRAWPRAGSGEAGSRPRHATVSAWPARNPVEHLAEFLMDQPRPLSARATQGFLRRAESSSLHFPDGLLPAARTHLERLTSKQLVLVAS